MRILLTGGGSGGHVSPALAVARVLQQRHKDIELLYVGGKLGMEGSTGPSIEEHLVVPTGIPFRAIHAGKLTRQRVSVGSIKRLWGVLPGSLEALRIVREFKPAVVFSTGGYVSLPVVLSAALLRIPIVIHEQTAAVGLANKVASRVATKVAITFAQSATFFPPHKVVLTGNPLREEILSLPLISLAQSELGLWLHKSMEPVVYVTGGGLGSHLMNVVLAEALPQLLGSMRIVHQCGAHAQSHDLNMLQKIQQTLPQELAQKYIVQAHFNASEVGLLLHTAQLVVARAGANTVLEIAACGVSALFIPIPWVTHDEQTRNAQILVQTGLARILPEKDLSPMRLVEEIKYMVKESPALALAQVKARKIVYPDAAQALAILLESFGSDT